MRPSEPRLRVALDATPLLGTRTGVGVFCRYALEALAARPDLEVGAFAVSWRRRGGIRAEVPAGVRVLDRPMPARPLHKAWSVSRHPGIEWFTGAQEVVHGTNFVVPPTRRAARVMTVHDLTSVRFPEMCDAYTRNFPRLVRRALAEGAWVHTPSSYVAGEVIELLGARPERVRAVHHGVPPVERDGAGAGIGAGRAAGAVPAGWAPVEGPYVLALGTVEPRKDLPTLVRAFDLVASEVEDLRLVVAGAEGWGSEAFLASVAASGHAGRIVRLGYVGIAQRAALLRGATVYAYPSLYEGFGLPPLEAMSVGVPVVTTRAGALPEVVGDAAELIDPGDAEGLAGALSRLILDPAARERLTDAGRRRVAAFSWSAAAEGLAGLYRDARAQSPAR